MAGLPELASSWYALLSTGYAVIADLVRDLASAVNVPLISALLFGILGAASPCQLTTNASALAYVAAGGGDRQTTTRNALAYLLGKMLVYTVLGLAVILAGRQLAQGSIPLIVLTRKLLGPLMIVVGLYLLGAVPLQLSVGFRLSAWLEARAGTGGAGAFLLGVAFAVAFCPTLFLLFFGLTIPLALSSPIGIVYPSVFAIGTTLPLLGLAAFIGAGAGATKRYVRDVRRLGAWARRAAAAVLVLAGLSDVVLYWFL